MRWAQGLLFKPVFNLFDVLGTAVLAVLVFAGLLPWLASVPIVIVGGSISNVAERSWKRWHQRRLLIRTRLWPPPGKSIGDC